LKSINSGGGFLSADLRARTLGTSSFNCRTNRKRLDLSQDDIAFLLGTQSGAKVCRYEKFARGPSLETALACEAIFQKPVSELFAGLYEQIAEKVGERAKALAYRMERGYASSVFNCALELRRYFIPGIRI
jgi:transcriptional regulator with XRE-family HTH domain